MFPIPIPKTWLLIGVAVLFAALLGSGVSIRHLLVKNADLKAETTRLEQVVKSERENHKKVVLSLEEKAKDVAQRAEFKSRNAKKIRDDSRDGDGAVAPVFLNTVDRLRNRQNGAD